MASLDLLSFNNSKMWSKSLKVESSSWWMRRRMWRNHAHSWRRKSPKLNQELNALSLNYAHSKTSTYIVQKVTYNGLYWLDFVVKFFPVKLDWPYEFVCLSRTFLTLDYIVSSLILTMFHQNVTFWSLTNLNFFSKTVCALPTYLDNKKDVQGSSC